MSKRKKIILWALVTLLVCGFTYLYIWEKPKLEKIVEKYAEAFSRSENLPFLIDIGSTHFSIIPLQLEIYDTTVQPKYQLKKNLDTFVVKKIAIRPGLIDLIFGKFWINSLVLDGASMNIRIDEISETPDQKDLQLDFNKVLAKIPVSQINLKELKLNVNYQNKYFLTTESLYLKAYNEKSSLVLTVKDPNVGLKNGRNGEFLYLLTDFQLLATKDTISISSVKIIKDESYFIASGNLIYDKTPDNIKEMKIQTRVKSNLKDLSVWSNSLYPNTWFEGFNGSFKVDIQADKASKDKDIALKAVGDVQKVQIGKVKIGDFSIDVQMPDQKHVVVNSLVAQLAGNNPAEIHHAKVSLGEKTTIDATVELNDAQLYTFMRDSGIAEIPVWLKLGGQVKCSGTYETSLLIECPGALTIKDLVIKNKGRTKEIVNAKKIDVAGSFSITEKQITYKAQASAGNTQGQSDGVINFEKGFNINYQTDNLNFKDVGKIADLKFQGTAKAKGSTSGDSDYAIFGMDLSASNFEFEDYFFGELTSRLDYKAGTLYFSNLKGNLESTRFAGALQVDLLNDKITGDIQLPFFRMTDIQQAILKKVDLQSRFTGSGSGRVRLDTPFDIDQLNFHLDARLFKGEAFGESYNEAALKAQAVDGIIIIQQGLLQKEKTRMNLRGTIDTKLISDLQFNVDQGFLQHSSLIKERNLPLSGEFAATGKIFGPLGSPSIKTSANVENLIFNKKKYGEALFSYDSSSKQTNLQFTLPQQLDLLIVLPDSNFDNVFVDANANQFDLAPIVAYAVSDEATRSYRMETTGEVSGKFVPSDFWQSEFSSTISEVRLDYKANKIATTIPTNIELKNGQLFLNEVNFVGNKNKQFINVTQPMTEKHSTKLVVNTRMNIGFFKIFAPFIEKIDGVSTLRLEIFINRDHFKLIGNSYTSGGFLKFPGFPHPIEDFTADILFNENKVSINSLSGQIAGGTLLGNGEVLFPGGKKFDLAISANMENVNINFPEGYRTSGSGNLSLTGSEAPFLLAGNYEVESGLIESNFSAGGSSTSSDLLEELLRKEITSPLVLNLDIVTKNPVEVRNSLVEGYLLGNLKVFDKISTPRIKGEAHFDRDSIIKVKDQQFDVTESSFEFEGHSPINPKLSMRAKTRMSGYDIDIFLQGRAQNPTLTMSSQPPLPESQIISMLALGISPNQFDPRSTIPTNDPNNLNSTNNLNSSGATNQRGFEVGTSMLSNNPLGKEIKESTGFDVQFSSSFDDQTSAAVPKVTLRRKLTKKSQLSMTSTAGNTQQQEGRLTYELNNEISTIFRVRNLPQNPNSNDGNDTYRRANSFGVDLEYKVEFD